VIRRVLARLSLPVRRVLGRLATRSPRAAFAVSNTLAALLATVSPGFRRALRRIPPHRSPRDTRRALRSIWRTRMRTRFLPYWIHGAGFAPVRALVRENDAIGRLRAPMILCTFHMGPYLGLGVLPEQLQGESMTLRCVRFTMEGVAARQVELVVGTEQERVAAFYRAIDHLRKDGFVIAAVDPGQANRRIAAPFFGGTLHLVAGVFAMARVAKVPLVPIATRWIGDEIEIVVGDPLAGGDDENALAASAAQWLEQYLRDWPGELSGRILELWNAGVLAD
jgi:lauroyl/myristoyl acyltransferase